MTHDEYNERSTASLLKDLIANQHSLYEDLQAVMEKLDYIENRIEGVLAVAAETPTSVKANRPAPAAEAGVGHNEDNDSRTDELGEAFGVVDLSGGEAAADTVETDHDAETKSVKEGKMSQDQREPDELYDAAEAVVIEQGKATQSLLQHELHIDAHRAKQLLELLEAEGVVGPYRPGKSRQVKITMMKE